MCQHRNQQVHLAMGGRAQNGAQLGKKHRRIGQAPADGSQTQRRIQVGVVMMGLVKWLVGPHIHGADRHRQSLHALDRAAVGLVLLFLVGQAALAAHEQKLAAEQAHADRPHLDRRQGVVRHLDVGQQFDPLPVQRDRRRVAQA